MTNQISAEIYSSDEPLSILFDTNIFIEREKRGVVGNALQDLMRLLQQNNHNILLHPKSLEEINQYGDEEGRKIAESKAGTYSTLEFPEYPQQNSEFRDIISEPTDENDLVDDCLLYAVYCGQVDVLITGDKEIHDKSNHLGIEDRVVTPEEGKRNFTTTEDSPLANPPSISKTTLGQVDLTDPIFDSLKESYPQFENWVNRHSSRPVWINEKPDGSYGAILVIKPNEREAIGDSPELAKRKRLKISTLKVAQDSIGSKIGELLISIALREAIDSGNEIVYLTHYVESKRDHLVELVEEYGFENVSTNDNGEAIFLKRLTPGPDSSSTPKTIQEKYYPSFFDGDEVNKYLVPIRPHYHRKLFTSCKGRQPTLTECFGEFGSEGNSIKKAYITNSQTKIDPQDILLFYRSKDQQQVTTLGVCEEYHRELTDPDVVYDLVRRRTALTHGKIEDYVDSSVSVILFRWHFNLSNPLSYQEMLREGLIEGSIRTIQEVSHNDYITMRKRGGIDECFTVS